MKKVYVLVLFGTCLSALGPSVFMAMLKAEQMNREFGISLFLLLGGLSVIPVYIVDSFTSHSNRKRIELGVREVTKLTLCGVLTATQFLAFTIAMQIGSVTETTMTVRISPLMSMLMGHFFLKEKVRSWKIMMISSTLCLGGVFFMQDVNVSSFDQASTLAMFWGILCAFALAAKNTLSSSLTSKHHSLPNLFVVAVSMIAGGLLMIPFVERESFSLPSTNQTLILIFLGIVTVAIPASINIYAFRATGSMGIVTYFSFFLPVLGAIAAYFICGEQGFNYLKLGLSFVVVSLGVYLIGKSPKKVAVNS